MNDHKITSEANYPKWAKLIDVSYASLLKMYRLEGPVCHTGSLINKEDATDEQVERFRNKFSQLPDFDFVGIDIFSGKNVDVVADLCDPDFQKSHPELLGRFGFMICRALLEHVVDPFTASRNIASMIKPGGHLYVGVPWVWGYHPYPNDYWRISIEGLKVLFKDFEWERWWYSGPVGKMGIEIDDPNHERKLFAQSEISGKMTQVVTDRGMPYLTVQAIAKKKLSIGS